MAVPLEIQARPLIYLQHFFSYLSISVYYYYYLIVCLFPKKVKHARLNGKHAMHDN